MLGELFNSWGKEVLSVFTLLPIVWYLIKKADTRNDLLLAEFKELRKSFEDHTLSDTNNLINIFSQLKEGNIVSQEIKKNMNNALLNKEQTIDLLKTQMWYISGKKLEFIKSIMINNHIKGNEQKIKEKLINGLLAFSDEYMSKFSTYNTPIGDLGKWLGENFSEKEFSGLINDIMIIIYRDDTGNTTDIINNKISEISLIMRTLQVGLANKLRAYLK